MSNKPTSILATQARYDGASYGRRLATWRAPSTGPNAAIAPAADTIRHRARDVTRNDSVAAAIVRTWASALVGSGIVARSRHTDPKIKEKLSKVWRDWMERADISDVQDFYGLQSIAAAAMVRDGEVFCNMVSVSPDEPIQLQMLEADFCPLSYNAELPSGNLIRSGIEITKQGKRAAYWMYREHPGETSNGTINASQLMRIPADQICHVFMPERAGQMRGVSWLAPILVQLKNLGEYQDATLERVKLANLFSGFVTRPEPAPGDMLTDPLTGQVITYDSEGSPMVAMEPGAMVELAPGEQMQFSAPPDAGPNYKDYNRVQVASISAAIGLPYEFVSGDVVDVSDRALRVIVNEYRRLVEQRQFSTIIKQFCAKVYAEVMRAAVYSGKISPLDLDGNSVEWAPPRFRHFHPVQDVNALRAEVEAGFRSRASVIAEYGYDVLEVDAERSADTVREEKLGLQTADDRLLQAEIDRNEAETEAARKAAQAASSQMRASDAKSKAAEAQTKTTDETRQHIVEAERVRVQTARMELDAAAMGMKELYGEKHVN